MRRILIFVVFVALLSYMCMALTVGKIQGPIANPDSPVRNIIYAHVPSSICALLCFVVILVASICYLATEKPKWEILGAAAAEVGAIFATILNVTGMIFSRAEWNIWWTPSLRLLSSAVLWFLYIVYLILRTSLAASPVRRAKICAVFGIIAFVEVPLVYMSARFVDDIHQPTFTMDTSWQRGAFFLGMISTVLLAALLIWIKTDILKIQTELERESID
jgi:heme exporter protein C